MSGGKTIQVERRGEEYLSEHFQCWHSRGNNDQPILLTKLEFLPMMRYQTTAKLAMIILKQCRQDYINLCFCFISDWALSDWANTVLENFKCQKLMELNGAFVEGINWNKISLFSTFQNISQIKFQLFVKKLSNVVPTELSKSFKIWTFNQLFPVSRSKECWRVENALYSEFLLFYYSACLSKILDQDSVYGGGLEGEK